MLAASSTDPVTRAAMIDQARRLLELANEPQGITRSDDPQDINDQMTRKP
jgi:hypothetical protein